jgi:hypothetical protein
MQAAANNQRENEARKHANHGKKMDAYRAM